MFNFLLIDFLFLLNIQHLKTFMAVSDLFFRPKLIVTFPATH